jgi:NAD(P)-dependent dehydrogenase (short-subunit alcohol dehydrogenase family)
MDGKVVIISGASRGLGRAMALALASAGAKVALVSRDADRLAAVFGEIQTRGCESQFFLADVAREEDVRRVEGEIITTFGRADILINNAGLNIRRQVIDYRRGNPEEIGQLAVYLCSREAGFITGADIVIDGGWCAQ